MKRSGPLVRRVPLRQTGKSDTTKIKERIQALLRQIVIDRKHPVSTAVGYGCGG
jgi:hypothetical protein